VEDWYLGEKLGKWDFLNLEIAIDGWGDVLKEDRLTVWERS